MAVNVGGTYYFANWNETLSTNTKYYISGTCYNVGTTSMAICLYVNGVRIDI